MVQNRGHMKMTNTKLLDQGTSGIAPVWGMGDFVSPEADTVFLILHTISVPNCDAYCSLQTIKFVQTYKYNFHILSLIHI